MKTVLSLTLLILPVSSFASPEPGSKRPANQAAAASAKAESEAAVPSLEELGPWESLHDEPEPEGITLRRARGPQRETVYDLTFGSDDHAWTVLDTLDFRGRPLAVQITLGRASGAGAEGTEPSAVEWRLQFGAGQFTGIERRLIQPAGEGEPPVTSYEQSDFADQPNNWALINEIPLRIRLLGEQRNDYHLKTLTDMLLALPDPEPESTPHRLSRPTEPDAQPDTEPEPTEGDATAAQWQEQLRAQVRERVEAIEKDLAPPSLLADHQGEGEASNVAQTALEDGTRVVDVTRASEHGHSELRAIFTDDTKPLFIFVTQSLWNFAEGGTEEKPNTEETRFEWRLYYNEGQLDHILQRQITLTSSGDEPVDLAAALKDQPQTTYLPAEFQAADDIAKLPANLIQYANDPSSEATNTAAAVSAAALYLQTGEGGM